jgi:hypothetical protein
LLLKALSRGKNSRDQGLENLSIYLSSKLDSPTVPWASGGREETADIFRALQFNGCSVRHDFLRTQRQNLPPFTLSPEPIKREQERGKEVFREVYNTIPVMRKA